MGQRKIREINEMSEMGNLELASAEPARCQPPGPPVSQEVSPDIGLRSSATQLARSLAWIPGQQEFGVLIDRCRSVCDSFQQLLASLESPSKNESDDFYRLRESVPLLHAELEDTRKIFALAQKIPQVRTSDGAVISRVAADAQDFLSASGYQFTESAFACYMKAFQEVTALKMAELWMVIPAMKIVLLEQIAEHGSRLLKNRSSSSGISGVSGVSGVRELIRSLLEIKQTTWKVVIEPLIVFDQVLREDPAGAYAGMDYESRELYRRTLVNIATHSDCPEIKVARHVLDLAREAYRHPDKDPRVTSRDSHVGNYL